MNSSVCEIITVWPIALNMSVFTYEKKKKKYLLLKAGIITSIIFVLSLIDSSYY